MTTVWLSGPASIIARLGPKAIKLSVAVLLPLGTFFWPLAVFDASTQAPADRQTPAVQTMRPFTVAESIQMTRLADPAYNLGEPSNGLVAHFSPDGKRFVVILKKGNVKNNTNDYSLLLFQTAHAFDSPRPLVLTSFSSSSNRPGIQSVRWLDDNTTLAFLAENVGQLQQLYMVDCRTKELTRLTKHTTSLVSYAISANGNRIVYAADPPKTGLLTEKVRREGISVSTQLVSDLLAGDDGPTVSLTHDLFLVNRSSPTTKKIDSVSLGYPTDLFLSPDGRHLIVETPVLTFPEDWKDYEDQFLQFRMTHLREEGSRSYIFRYSLIDLASGLSRPLLDSPISTLGSEVAWASDSQSVVVAGSFLPLNVSDPGERKARQSGPSVVEVRVPGGEVSVIAHEKLKLLSWNTKSNLLLLQARSFGDTDRPAVVYQKNGTVWERVETRKLSASQRGPIDVVLAEDMNTPPKIFAVDPQTGQKALVLDLNPQFGELRLGKVEAVTWKATDGREVEGGLYYPPGYVRGQRYPLVIQSHGFTRERFWVDGPWSTAFAAQPLANRGFVVLQVGPAKNLDEESRFVLTPNEPIRWMSGVEGAIDYLDRIGLIDSARVGIIGFSRTCFYVQYALTHSVFHFAAALVADGIDGGYVQYIVYANANPELAAEFDAINSGPPFGDGLSSWLKLAPGFSLNTVKTPLRIEANSRSTLLGEWEWFSGLSRLHKPVELIYLPEGTHILEKPWERITSQQGSVDWFCFWLKGEEDPDPAKAERYARWRELRKQHEENMKKLCARSQEQLCLGPLAFRRSRCKLFSRPEEPTYIVR